MELKKFILLLLANTLGFTWIGLIVGDFSWSLWFAVVYMQAVGLLLGLSFGEGR
jgi:uncharacterized membrane protein